MLVFSATLVCFSSVLSLILFSHLPLVLTFPTALLPKVGIGLSQLVQSYFTVFQPEDTHPSFDGIRAIRSFISHSALPFLPLNFSWLPKNRSTSTGTGLNKIANHMLKHILYFGIDFYVHVFKRF